METNNLDGAVSAAQGQGERGEWRESMRQEAACEIEAIARMLQCQPNAAYQVVRALGMRLEQLARIVLSSDDEVQGSWADWGRFRAVVHRVVYEALTQPA